MTEVHEGVRLELCSSNYSLRHQHVPLFNYSFPSNTLGRCSNLSLVAVKATSRETSCSILLIQNPAGTVPSGNIEN
jgi:hypothetical protein